MEISSEFAQRYTEARQGLHELVEKERDSNPNIVDKEQIIVDINVSGQYKPTEFMDFTAAEREYAYLAEYLPGDEQDYDVLGQNIAADSTMIQLFQGREVEPEDFMRTVAGHMPETDSDDEIDGLVNEIDKRYQLLGLRYDVEGTAAYNERYVLKDAENIREVFEKSIAIGRIAVEPFVKVSIDLLNPEFINDSKVPWSGYLTSDDHGNFNLIANIDPSKLYTKPAIARWMLHEEGGHHVQIKGLWERAIREGKMNPAVGLTSMTSPLNTYAEIAPYIAEKQLRRVYPELTEDEDTALHAEIEDMYGELFTMAVHRAIAKVVRGVDDKERQAIIDEACAVLPREPYERIEAVVSNAQTKPTYRAAFASYGYIRQLMEGLTGPEYGSLIKDIYSSAQTLQQAEALVRPYREDVKTVACQEWQEEP